MTIRHTITCDDSEVLVREIDPKSYQVSIQAQVNPLGKGNVLETFPKLEEAIVAAEHFCKLHTAAKSKGYYLENGHFVKPDRPKIHVGQLLNERKDPEAMLQLLEN
ncbi:hypothetical protein [Paenibacillus agricola]|uniref:Uncharacterized protein n=1 Tax=Paenibacillus agricola TaxID=2716264 RepID=A0ABX0J1M6_9BACL|nr:hypothetical protein [Paenibacillus agricola]NHN29736.1 hypothetical protein [Paenibacillus agricola]